MAACHGARPCPGSARGARQLKQRSAPRRAASNSAHLDELLSRRILFVAGKGGSGKTSVAAALALLGARRNKRVLCIEVDAKGDLAAALGAGPVGFDPVLVQTNISVLALLPEESLREYLKVYFKVPRVFSLTPLSRVYDFIASSVPGPKDMLIIGKIAYEERRQQAGRPVWDLIVVDCSASGRALAQLQAAREMRKLTRGGVIRSQLEWIDAAMTDHTRTALVITALPEEMPVVEAIELYHDAVRERYIHVGGCFLNRMPPAVLGAAERRLMEALGAPDSTRRLNQRTGADSAALVSCIEIIDQLAQTAAAERRQLIEALDTPVIEVPLQLAKPGLGMSRAVAAAMVGVAHER